MRQPGMRRYAWKRMVEAEQRIKDMAQQLGEAQLKVALAGIKDDVMRRAVARRIFDLTQK